MQTLGDAMLMGLVPLSIYYRRAMLALGYTKEEFALCLNISTSDLHSLLEDVDPFVGHVSSTKRILKEIVHVHSQECLKYLESLCHSNPPPGSLRFAEIQELGALIVEFNEEMYTLPEASPRAMVSYALDHFGLDIIELAEQVGMRAGRLRAYLTGISGLTRSEAEKLEERLELPPGRLYEI